MTLFNVVHYPSEDSSTVTVLIKKQCSSRGGDWTSLLGPGEPYTPNSEKDTSCLGPVEPYTPSTHISELIVLAHIGKKREPKGRPTTLAGPGSHLDIPIS